MISKELLIQEYIKNKKPVRKIAKELGCGHSNILYYMKKYIIPRRTISEANEGKKRPDISKRMKGNKNGLIDGRRSKIYYCRESGCNNEICYENWLYGYKRCQSCAMKERLKNPEDNPMFGKKGIFCPSYIDGRGYEPYSLEFNNDLKESIRKRDNYRCQGKDCSMTEEEHIIIYGRDIEIHHIDHNKQNCEKSNLITTCKQCNCRANFNRDYWQNYFKEKIEVLL